MVFGVFSAKFQGCARQVIVHPLGERLVYDIQIDSGIFHPPLDDLDHRV